VADDTVTIHVPMPHLTLFDSKRDGMPEIIRLNEYVKW
jgi:hypothetical protein